MSLSKLIKISLWLVVVIFLSSLVYAVFTLQNNQRAYLSKPVRYNVFSPTVFDNTIRYYNGNTFVYYDIASGETKPLTKRDILPNLKNIYWLPHGVVFQSSAIEKYSSLFDDFTKFTQLSSDAFYESPSDGSTLYWYLSFTDDSASVISDDNGNVSLFGAVTNDQMIFRFNQRNFGRISSDGKINKELSVIFPDESEIRMIGIEGETYYYVDKINDAITVHKGSITTKSDEVIIDNLFQTPGHSVFEPIYYHDKAIYYTNNDALSSYNVTTKEKRTITQPFYGSINTTNTPITGYSTGKSAIKLFVYDKDKIKSQWSASLPHSSPRAFLAINNTYWYIDLFGRMYQVSPDLSVLSNTKPGYHEALEKKLNTESLAVDREIMSGHDNQYTLTFLEGNPRTIYKETYDMIKKEGVDPYQITLILNPGPRVVY